MKSSIGGVVNLFLLLVFIVVLSSFLLFNVNYSKAYRVKNRVITALEQFEGKCDKNSTCYNEIEQFENNIGYNNTDMNPEDEEICVNELGYCYKEECTSKDNTKSCVYEVRTEVDMNFPLIREIMGIVDFKIKGKTKAIVKEK